MRMLPLFIIVALTGCRSVEPTPLPASVLPAAPVVQAAPPVRTAERNPVERRQAQLIEALINQNEALTQRLAANRSPAPVVPERRADKPSVVAPARPFLVANAEGFIDMRAPEGKSDEPVNPFDVSPPIGGKGREVSLTVSGIIAGAETCAVINERMVQPGDAIESLTVETIARDAVFLALGERRLKLNVSETPVRVRLPD